MHWTIADVRDLPQHEYDAIVELLSEEAATAQRRRG